MMHDWTGTDLLEQTPSSEPDVTTGNTSSCYICGYSFTDLVKLRGLRECVVKLEHTYRSKEKHRDRLIHYFISVCVWCYNAHCKDSDHKR